MVTHVPNSITGRRPAASAIRPLMKRDANAPIVNKPTIHPIKSGRPSAVKNPGNSGMIMPKLAMNNTVLAHNHQN
jgi:hypothetical protein